MRPTSPAAALIACLLVMAHTTADARGGASARSLPAAKGRRVLQPFDYAGVTLDDGPLKRQFDETRAFYLAIPNDDLLKGFRARAGRAAPGLDLGGWYSADVFHIFGQVLSGLARMHRATGDPACKAKLDALVHEWGACIAPDGYFYYSRTPNAPHYTYDKMVGGLVDAMVYGGNREAPRLLRRITDWAVRRLDRARPYGADPNEWYTLSENLYRAWLATGDPVYRDFARVWEYTDYWGIYARGGDIHAPRPDGKQTGGYHAYSHVNTLSGAAAAYLVTGESHYLDTIRHAWDYLQARQCFATGGYGPDEALVPRDDLLRRLAETHNTFETQCGSWAAFKLCKYLMAFTGEARYGDWVERLAINGIGASLPSAADGRVFYYADYNPSGGTKVLNPTGWTCCAGTRPMAIADYHDLIWFHEDASLCVNLYAASTVRWQRRGGVVTVRQSTRFPEDDTTRLSVETAAPAAFALKLRAPAWLAAPMQVRVNGRALKAAPDARGWVALRRTWRGGDRVDVRLPMGFRVSRLDPRHEYPCAVMRGPVVLAFRCPGSTPAGRIDLSSLDRALVRGPGEPLTWRLASDPAVLARPFYAVRDGETTYVYLDPAARYRVPHSAVRFTGPWQNSGGFRFSNVVGAAAETTFEGTGIRWLGYRFDDGGRAEVRIDDRVVGIVDQYGPGRGLPFDWKVEGLPPGRHTVRLVLLEEKSPESKDRYLNVAGFEVLPADQAPSR